MKKGEGFILIWMVFGGFCLERCDFKPNRKYFDDLTPKMCIARKFYEAIIHLYKNTSLLANIELKTNE